MKQGKNLIHELESVEQENLSEILERETLPLVMWGAGSSAPEVSRYLEKKKIPLADVFVDDQFYIDGMEFQGKRVLSYSQLREKYEEVNVILGNSNYEKADILKTMVGIRKVFSLFSMSYDLYEKTPLSVIEESLGEFQEVYNCLEDELSKQNFMAFLKTRVSGNNRYITDIFCEESNFFNNDIFQVGFNEVYLDVGAFNGDTIRLFLQECRKSYKHIYAIEPDPDNYTKLQVESSEIRDLSIKECGAWKESGMLEFHSSGNQMSSVLVEDGVYKEEGNMVIPVFALDDLFDYKDKVSIMKINYMEGVIEALQGAEKILREHMPKVIITVGFDCRNIRKIPILIKNINPKYKLYLRYNRGMVSALTLYGTV